MRYPRLDLVLATSAVLSLAACGSRSLSWSSDNGVSPDDASQRSDGPTKKDLSVHRDAQPQYDTHLKYDTTARADTLPWRDSAPAPRDVGPWTDAWPRDVGPQVDACVRPAGWGCNSSSSCPPSLVCGGCFPDPCCPQCSSCRPACIKPSSCSTNGDCAPHQYCAKSTCGIYGYGSCSDRPLGCPAIYAPVCGCDGQTYNNKCEAASAGQDVAQSGECAPKGDPRCQNVNCKILEDCCSCSAHYDWEQLAYCKMACVQSACQQKQIYKPYGYCAAGRCFVGDASDACKTDQDCQLINDCCDCRAATANEKAAPCPAACYVDSCTAQGVYAPRAVCVEGTCRVVETPPPSF